jgi:hypothetical protein
MRLMEWFNLMSINLGIFIQVNLFAQAVTQKQFPLLSPLLNLQDENQIMENFLRCSEKVEKRDVRQYVCLLSVHMSLQKNSTEIRGKVENNL